MSVSGNNMAHRAVSPHYAKISHRVSGSSSLLDPLLSMGFPEHQVQKALAATGRTSVELAAKWLKSHDKDPSLDDPIPQEYVLYLVPTGPLAVTLSNFWAESLRLCGRNRAHSCFPHITLCEFFTVRTVWGGAVRGFGVQTADFWAQPVLDLQLQSAE
eukprot:XP_004920396.1 PREDICTED: ubiquitin-associated and SH3 domain-containing protein A-like [Xenopus tropicalis]